MTQNIDQIIMLWFRFECIWRVLEPVVVVHPHFKIYAFLIIIHCLKSSDKEGCEWYRVQRHWQSVCKHVHGRWSVILTVPVTSLCNLKNCALYNTWRKKKEEKSEKDIILIKKKKIVYVMESFILVGRNVLFWDCFMAHKI